MMASVTNSPDAHPARIPGYDGGPFNHLPELLDEPSFWLGHLHNYYSESEAAEELVGGTDEQEAAGLQSRLLGGDTWPVFTVPLADEHRLYVVYRAFKEDEGIDYLLHHPDWDAAEHLAQDEGHFMRPGLSWPELTAAADNGLPGGSTTDAHNRLLLLLPALGDDAVPDEAVDRLTAALRARTRVEPPSGSLRRFWRTKGRVVPRTGPRPRADTGSTTVAIPSATLPTTSPGRLPVWPGLPTHWPPD